jgi:tetratricopeptide (TPR) repeat protein
MQYLLSRAGALALCLALAHPTSAAEPTPSTPAASPTLTAEEWRDDLLFLADEMKRRHANLYHTVSRQRLEAAIADLHARIPSLGRNEIVVGMMRIAAMVGDGHTRIDPRKDKMFGFRSLPLKLYQFEDGIFVRAAAPEFAGLIGASIEAVGGVPIDEAVRRVSEISSTDNTMGYKKFAPIYLNMPDVLHALKMSPRRDAATFRLRKGSRTWSVTIPAGGVEPLWPADTDVSLVTPDGWVDGRSAPQPIWLQAPLDYHRLIDMPEQKALYAQINMITGINGQSLGQFGEKIRKQAEATNPRAVVVDFRLAHGGNHDLRHPFIRELVKIEDEDTRLFVLTGRGSYSATEAILVDLDRLTNGVLIGEPAASKPNSFGDSYRTSLPNSGISVRTSIYWNQLAPAYDRSPWTWVDVSAPYFYADYAAGRDPALAAALAHTPQLPLFRQALEAANARGVAGAVEVVSAYRCNPVNRYQNLGRLIPLAAEQLSLRNKHAEAIAVAEFGTSEFPASADASLILSYVALRAGRKDLALRAGNRTLELDPNNRNVRSLIEAAWKR